MPNYDDLFTGQTTQQEEKPFDKTAWAARKQAEREGVYRHGEDVHSIVSIRFDKELLKQAAEKDGQDAPKHRFILLTEEELEQKFIELEEQENAEQQKGK